MDDAELVKAVAEGTAKGVTEPIRQLIINMFGRATEVLGEAFKARALRFKERTMRMLAESGGADVKPTLQLAAIIQYGCLEEDDYLQDRWATLLVNTAAGEGMPAAPEILRQLTGFDVLFLQMCFDVALKQVCEAQRLL